MTSFAAQVAEVSVDPETGQVKLLRFTTAHDVGQIVNPIGHLWIPAFAGMTPLWSCPRRRASSLLYGSRSLSWRICPHGGGA
ncbi:MAG: molybdopterin cofactor-binding domain-containing protein [Candidatus Entotheonellia bacterium]